MGAPVSLSAVYPTMRRDQAHAGFGIIQPPHHPESIREPFIVHITEAPIAARIKVSRLHSPQQVDRDRLRIGDRRVLALGW